MALTRDEVLHIARLARLGLSEDEVTTIQGQLSNILEQFEALRAIDTEGVPATAYTLALENVAREDVARPSLPRETVLAAAPLHEGHYLRVRRVLE